MRRHLLAVLALVVVGGLGLFVGGCSSGCGHCDDPCFDDAVCHDGCAEVACEPCGDCLDVWYQCPCCGTTSAYDGCCVHCGDHLEVRHAGCSVSPEGCEEHGSAAGGYGWQIEIAQAERGRARAQVAKAPAPKVCNCPDCQKKRAAASQGDCPDCAKKAAATKHQDCPDCAKKASAPKPQGCAECAKQNAPPQRRTVVREKPAPQPMSVRKGSAKAAGDG
mgnify:CR=1 FL=1